MPKPNTYSKKQIILHWVVFVLIAMQFIMHEGIEKLWDKIEQGQSFVMTPAAGAHLGGGMLVFSLMVWRFVLRRKHGVPEEPQSMSKLMRLGATLAHWAFYILILLIVASGMSAWFGQILPAAEAHEAMTGALFFLIIGHALAALYHHFVVKDDVLKRMLKST